MSSEERPSRDNAAVRSRQPMRTRAASARAESRDSRTTLAPSSANNLAIASPMPIEAPVTTTTCPTSSMLALYSPRRGKSRRPGGLGSAIPVVQSGIPRLDADRCNDNGATTVRIGDSLALLPLFPLDVVLLPGAPLPLHIFEPRYKEMIGECLANEAPFGVIRALDDGVSDAGWQ